jgi:ligand-binding sensor domain-containing protein/signal transduction histidine kinase
MLRRVLSRTRCRFLILGLLIFVFHSTCFAQALFDVWTTDQGLPQNAIQDIVQTRDGYLWLATTDGLVRFDGVRFTVFNSGNTPGLKSNRFTRLFEDREGTLWIGTEDAGLARYKDGAFVTYTVADGLPSNWILQIRGDPNPNGKIWVRASGGIMIWPEKTLLPRDLRVDLPASRFRYLDRQCGIWFYDGVNLSHTKDGVETIYAVKDGLTSDRVTALFLDREGSLWIANAKAELQRLRNGTFRTYTARDGLPEEPARSFYQDREGHLWLATNAGLARLSYGNDDTRYDAARPNERVRRYTTAEGLSSNTISSIYEDVEGSLWVGTANKGLNHLRRQVISSYSVRDGLAADNVYPIYQDRNGSIWMGTWAEGLSVYNNDRFTPYPRQKTGELGSLVTSIAEDRQGRLWVGSYHEVCWLKNGNCQPFAEKLQLNGGGISVIFEDRKGDFWLGTDNAGLYRYHEARLSHFGPDEGFPSIGIHAIVEDRDGILWIGTYGGLVKFKDEKPTVYTTRDGLASNRIRSLYQDADGTLWIGTSDGGLTRYKDNHFTSYTVRDGLFNSGVFQILEDDHGYLWCSCNQGIYRLSKRELNDFADGKIHQITSTVFGKADGMLNQECNGGEQPAGIKARDGKLWFPTQGGVAVVDPEAVRINSHPPPVVIESALVDRVARDLNQPLRIEPGQTSLEIHYAGLSFIKPEQVKFRYKLEGVDHDWVDAGNRRVAYYSHLAPGTYTFTVVAANSDSVWNTTGRQLRITIIPPFWLRWWFLILCAVVIVVLIFSLYRWRVARLEQSRIAQEEFSRRLIASQEQERQRIAAELHDSLGQNLLIIKNRALLGLTAGVAETAPVEQLHEISSTATQAIEEVRQIARNLRPYKLDRLGLTKALESIIAQAADSSEINFSARVDSVDGLFSREAEINLYRIVQESVNNVLKHSQATNVQLLVEREERNVRFEINDDGAGFDFEALKAENADQRGIGLDGIAERARIIGGKHSIRSTPGKGTTIAVTIGTGGQKGRKGEGEKGSSER